MAHVDVINNALQLELNLFLVKIIEKDDIIRYWF